MGSERAEKSVKSCLGDESLGDEKSRITPPSPTSPKTVSQNSLPKAKRGFFPVRLEWRPAADELAKYLLFKEVIR
jgi:hypothetical protein